MDDTESACACRVFGWICMSASHFDAERRTGVGFECGVETTFENQCVCVRERENDWMSEWENSRMRISYALHYRDLMSLTSVAVLVLAAITSRSASDTCDCASVCFFLIGWLLWLLSRDMVWIWWVVGVVGDCFYKIYSTVSKVECGTVAGLFTRYRPQARYNRIYQR